MMKAQYRNHQPKREHRKKYYNQPKKEKTFTEKLAEEFMGSLQSSITNSILRGYPDPGNAYTYASATKNNSLSLKDIEDAAKKLREVAPIRSATFYAHPLDVEEVDDLKNLHVVVSPAVERGTMIGQSSLCRFCGEPVSFLTQCAKGPNGMHSPQTYFVTGVGDR